MSELVKSVVYIIGIERSKEFACTMVALIPLEHIFEFAAENGRRKDSLRRANEFVRRLSRREMLV